MVEIDFKLKIPPYEYHYERLKEAEFCGGRSPQMKKYFKQNKVVITSSALFVFLLELYSLCRLQ